MCTGSHWRLARLWPTFATKRSGIQPATSPEDAGRLRLILMRVLAPSVLIAAVMTALTFV